MCLSMKVLERTSGSFTGMMGCKHAWARSKQKQPARAQFAYASASTLGLPCMQGIIEFTCIH